MQTRWPPRPGSCQHWLGPPLLRAEEHEGILLQGPRVVGASGPSYGSRHQEGHVWKPGSWGLVPGGGRGPWPQSPDSISTGDLRPRHGVQLPPPAALPAGGFWDPELPQSSEQVFLHLVLFGKLWLLL